MDCKGCNDWETLNYLKLIYFKNKQVSLAEATYRLLNGLSLKRSNITCIHIASGFQRNRSSFFKPVGAAEKPSDVLENDFENCENDEEIDFNNNETVYLPGRKFVS